MDDSHDDIGNTPDGNGASPLPLEAKSGTGGAESARAADQARKARPVDDRHGNGCQPNRSAADSPPIQANSPADAAESARAYDRPCRPATYRDVLDAPGNMVAEVVGGILHTQPRPAPPHARTHSSLGGTIFVSFDKGVNGPGGWWILDEPELHLGPDPDSPDILVPDIAGWRRETMPRQPATAYFTVPPDWACEILSPSTRDHDLEDKCPIYAREGVGHLWLLDPGCRRLEALELRNGVWVAVGEARDNETVCLPPFQAIRFSLGELWWPDPPEAPEGDRERD